MVTQTVTVDECNKPEIIIGRRGTFGTEEIIFDLSDLIESYGNGSAVLMVKRPKDIAAYPTTTTQNENQLSWIPNEIDTSYKGSGACELFWYVDGGLSKSVVYPLIIERDIGTTSETVPDPYESWIDDLTALGAETLQNAQNAAQSEANAKESEVNAKASEEAAAESESNAEDNALKAEGYAVGTQDGVEVEYGSPYFHDNAKFWATMAEESAGKDGWVHFYIDDEGYLHYVKTANCALGFYIDTNGILHATNA